MSGISKLDEAIVSAETYADPALLQSVFAQLRQEDPVHWTAPDNYRPFWTITKHADIREVGTLADGFINAPRGKLFNIDEERRMLEQTGGSPANVRTIVNMDAPDHRVYRGIAQSWFSPKNLKTLEVQLADLAVKTVDRMCGMGGECDFVKDVAMWFPLRVIMTILGVPAQDETLMLMLTQELFGNDDPEMRRDAANTDVNKTVGEIFTYFSAITADRRAHPRDDLASTIANAQINGQQINDFEALSYYLVIASAGHDTTSASISGGLLALIQNPSELARLRDNPELMSSAVDEMIRWSTPVRHFFRTATQDYSLRGKQIKAGDSLLLAYPSGNRDEELFESAHAFKVDRAPGKHVAFGFGPHVCIGQHLARMELKALFTELLSRIDHIELAGVPRYIKTNFIGGLKSLPISFHVREYA